MTRLTDLDYCRSRRDLEMAKAWRARANNDHIWVHLCAKQARDWNHSLLRELRKAKS